MPFWQSSSSESAAHSASKGLSPAEQLTVAKQQLTKARRNLLGAAVMLLGAFLLIPVVLDKKPRAWGEDVILSMPKADAPFKRSPASSTAVDAAPAAVPAPIDSTNPIKPSQPEPVVDAVPAAPALRVAP